jgi:hypothetical protein
MGSRPPFDPFEIAELERALLRRGVDERSAESERCTDCHRTPLIGERLYIYDDGAARCELCRALNRQRPTRSRLIHGPEFGHTMKILDRRAAA